MSPYPAQSSQDIDPERVEDYLGKNRDSLGKPREIEARIKDRSEREYNIRKEDHKEPQQKQEFQ